MEGSAGRVRTKTTEDALGRREAASFGVNWRRRGQEGACQAPLDSSRDGRKGWQWDGPVTLAQTGVTGPSHFRTSGRQY